MERVSAADEMSSANRFRASKLSNISKTLAAACLLSEPGATVAGLPQHWHVLYARTDWVLNTFAQRMDQWAGAQPRPIAVARSRPVAVPAALFAGRGGSIRERIR